MLLVPTRCLRRRAVGEPACRRREMEALVLPVEKARRTGLGTAKPTRKARFQAVRILDPEAGLVLGVGTLGRKAGPLDHRRGKGWEFLHRHQIVEGLVGRRKALVPPSRAGDLAAGFLVLFRLLIAVLVGFVVVVLVGYADGCRPRSWARRGRDLSRSMKRRKLCGRRRRNLFGRCEGGLEPSCSSQDGPTPVPTALAAIRSARVYVAAVAVDDDEGTASP